MSLRTFKVRLAGNDLPIALSSNAIRALERESGMPLARFAMLLSIGRAGYGFLQMFLWAALEGGRIRSKAGRNPFTLEEVGELIDGTDDGPMDVWRDPDDGMEEVEEGGVKVKKQVRPPVEWHPVMKELMEAWYDQAPKARPDDKPNPPTASESSPGTNT